MINSRQVSVIIWKNVLRPFKVIIINNGICFQHDRGRHKSTYSYLLRIYSKNAVESLDECRRM